jgi:enterochelin esterase family protein
MRRLLVYTLSTLLLCVTAVASQRGGASPESPLIAALQHDVAAGRPDAVEAFWRVVESHGSPLIETPPEINQDVLATFVWKDPGDTTSVILNARVDSADPLADPRSRMRRLADTDVWYLSHRFPADAEFLYQLVLNLPASSGASPSGAMQRALRPDPLNLAPYPDKSDPLFDPIQPWRNGSIARMPAAPANPWLAVNEAVRTGELHETTLKSSVLTMANPRRVWVYTPPDAQLRNPNLLIVFDGGTTYQYRIPTATILDNLYAAQKIDQTVAVFVDNGADARALDMTFSDAFVKFLGDELLPWVQQTYQFKADPTRTILCGDSLGGLLSAYAALRRPDAFGKVISQSGSFQFKNQNDSDRQPEWLVRQFANATKSNVFFHLDVGQMEDRPEGNDGSTLLDANRHLRDLLRTRGYAVHYVEVYSDHDPVHWRRTLPEALMVTLGH